MIASRAISQVKKIEVSHIEVTASYVLVPLAYTAHKAASTMKSDDNAAVK
jgi:hypothetical protein